MYYYNDSYIYFQALFFNIIKIINTKLCNFSICIYNRLLLNILYVINQKYGLNL